MADEAQKEAQKTEGKGGFFRKCLSWRMGLVGALVAGLLGGVIIWGGLNMGMEYTNRSDFCMSCHEMTIPFEELKKTVHFKNRSGDDGAVRRLPCRQQQDPD